jgi:ketosteroid isomerase-like protein
MDMDKSTPERRVVETMFAAFDHKDLALAVSTVSEDTLWIHHGTQKLPSMRFVGKRGVRQFFETNFTAMQMAYFRVKQLIQDGHTVVALGEEQFTMAGQPDPLAQQWVQVYTVRAGLITRMEEFASSAAASDYRVVD